MTAHKSQRKSAVVLHSLGRVMTGGKLSEPRFHNAVLAALEAEPIEDGYRHPAEEILAGALAIAPDAAPAWIRSLFTATALQRPTLAAALMQCLGRLPRGSVDPWGLPLARNGLHHSNVELRDAAAGAIEHWEGQDGAQALLEQAAIEFVPWLAEYMREVAAGLLNDKGANRR